jgi:hypothetical protein
MSQGGIWNLGIIKNIYRLFNRNPADDAKKPYFYFFLYEKLQTNHKEIVKKIADGMNIFLKSYFQLKTKYDSNPFWRDYRTINVNNFEVIVMKLKSFKSTDDTGLVSFKILSECCAEIEDESSEYIEKTVK